ncbi:MAG: sigma-70 family RNA polymerase sigma factor [Proteobacteria bacterium]|nr:sigma-70 family RNA polymerase sigma factor [Pseudomonadota bacterium]
MAVKTLKAANNQKDPSKARLDELARRYYTPLLSFFRKRTRNAPEVPDLVQQVFLKLAQHGEPGAIEHAEGYIFQTAANTLRDHFRHEIVRERYARDPLTLASAADSDFAVERVLEARESLLLVVTVIRGLPERTRDVLTLRVFEGLKYSEIAHLYGISTRAVEKHMAKALARLTAALGGRP